MADAEPAAPEPTAVSWPTWPEVVSRLLGADRRRLAAFVASALLLVGGAVAGYALVRTPPAPATELTLPFAGAGAGAGAGAVSTSTTTATEVLVHAAGAVVVPGLHRLPAGSRVADVLTAAGGPAPDADLDRVNLAAPLTDGERVWFPRVGELAPPPMAGGGETAAEAGGAGAGPVNLNTASAEDLDQLPGIGPATAAAILEHRDRNGPFRSVEDLLDVPGIGDAKLAQLRDLVTV